MAMPYMEQAPDADQFYRDLIQRVKSFPNGMKKTVFELQATNWRTSQKVSSQELASTIQSLYSQGVMHVGYYPDDPIQGHPDPKVMHDVFATQSSQLVP